MPNIIQIRRKLYIQKEKISLPPPKQRMAFNVPIFTSDMNLKLKFTATGATFCDNKGYSKYTHACCMFV
jgi:hypothetical protein